MDELKIQGEAFPRHPAYSPNVMETEWHSINLHQNLQFRNTKLALSCQLTIHWKGGEGH